MATKTIDLITPSSLETLLKNTDSLKKIIFDIDHPKNSEYVTSIETDMSTLSNGTWTLIYNGKIGGTTLTGVLEKNTISAPIPETNVTISAQTNSSGKPLAFCLEVGTSNDNRFIVTGGSGAALDEGHASNITSVTRGSSITRDGKLNDALASSYCSGLKGSFPASSISGTIDSSNVNINISNAKDAINVYVYKRTN